MAQDEEEIHRSLEGSAKKCYAVPNLNMDSILRDIKIEEFNSEDENDTERDK